MSTKLRQIEGSAFADALRAHTGCTILRDAIAKVIAEIESESPRHGKVSRLERLCEILRIKHVEMADIPYEGLLLPDSDNSYRVLLNRYSGQARARFTLAHEIGHAILHRLMPETRELATRQVWTPPGSLAEESLCDAI